MMNIIKSLIYFFRDGCAHEWGKFIEFDNSANGYSIQECKLCKKKKKILYYANGDMQEIIY